MQSDVDTKTVGKAFKVEINGQFLPIKSYSGGDLTAEKAEASSGASQHNECTMGHNYITELTLVAYITPTSRTLSDGMNAVANQGKNERFEITVSEMAKDKSVVKTFVYQNCLLTSLDFPRFDAHGGQILCETATFKPERVKIS
jgi:phage tail-like protein